MEHNGYRIDPDLDRVPDNSRQPVTELDLMANPELRRSRAKRSIKQAIWYTVFSCVSSILIALAIIGFSRWQGGPLCGEGTRTLICSRTYEILFPTVTGGFSLATVIGAMVILHRKWKRYDLWQPWFGVIWFLIPWAMTIMTGFGTMAIVGQ
ncbi:hypothetical protein WG915_08020 [Corynebacterium sp. H128]|uniref:hypothetical protein n=1 Tax=unclassified Corynebacterium TaxID=2624378 RepID=UPI0030B12906